MGIGCSIKNRNRGRKRADSARELERGGMLQQLMLLVACSLQVPGMHLCPSLRTQAKAGKRDWQSGKYLGQGTSAPLVGSGTVHRSLCCTSSSQACPILVPAPLSNRQGHQAASACRGVTSAEASGCRRYACDVERSQRAIYRLRQTYKCMHASNLHCSLFG